MIKTNSLQLSLSTSAPSSSSSSSTRCDNSSIAQSIMMIKRNIILITSSSLFISSYASLLPLNLLLFLINRKKCYHSNYRPTIMRITISVAILVAFLSSSCTSARLFQRRSSRSSPIGKVEMVATQNSTTHSSLDESDDDWQNSQFTAARIISSSSNLEASNLTRNDSISNIPESECDETDRHRHTNHRRSNSKSNDLSSLLPALPFLPILIVLALMFICLCAVLRLFSKAHFRDHRSSIFVNPRTLDVAQAQERRMSQLSQCSARMTPSRRPTIVSSNYYHRSPIASINSAMQIQAAASRSARSSWSSNGSSGGPGGCDAVPLANMAPITLIAPNNRASTLSVYHASNSILMKEKARSNSISSSSLLR